MKRPLIGTSPSDSWADIVVDTVALVLFTLLGLALIGILVAATVALLVTLAEGLA